MLERLKKYKYHLLAFLIPMLILFFIYFIRCHLRETSFFVSDSFGQYLALLSYFKDVTLSEQSILYSFSKGLGGSMLGTYSYYLASPLNWLIIFFSKDNLDIFFVILILLKLGLSSLFMYIYIDSKNIKKQPLKLSLSICYALMAYNVGYYFNFMWLDGICLTPLIVLGIEKLIKEGKSLLYGITLLLAILCNYYIGYILCIFSCIYFVYFLIINYGKQGKKFICRRILKFICVSFLAGMSTMVLLIPTLMELRDVQRIAGVQSNSFKLLEFLSKGFLASNNFDNILNASYVNWYSGIIILVLVQLFFLNKKISLKEKLASLVVIIMFILSFKINILNYIWHGFTNPNFFNYRYSFLFTFFLIILSIRNLENYSESTKVSNLIMILLFVAVSLVIILQSYEWINYLFVWISVVLFIFYILMIKLCYSLKDKRNEKIITILILILVISELSFNIFLIFRDYEYVYLVDYEDFISSKDIVFNEENSLYRMEYNDKKTSNDSLGLNYKGITSFLSTSNTDVFKFLYNLGYTYKSNAIMNNSNNTLITDSLLGVKRIYSLEDYNYIYDKIGEYDCSSLDGLFRDLGKTTCSIYDNSSALNFGYMISDNEKKYLKEINKENKNVFENQNILLNSMLNNNTEYFKKYNVVPISVNEYKYKVDDSNMLYLYMDVYIGTRKTKVDIYINGNYVTSFNDSDTGIKKIKNEYKNQEIIISFEVDGDVSILSYPILYSLDTDRVKKDLDILKENEFKIKKLSNTNVKGTIIATKEKSVFFTSIPYDKGWTVYVDGKKVKTYKLYDCFLGLKLSEGKHEIEFSYYPPGLNLGIGISVGSFILLVLYLKFLDKKLI